MTFNENNEEQGGLLNKEEAEGVTIEEKVLERQRWTRCKKWREKSKNSSDQEEEEGQINHSQGKEEEFEAEELRSQQRQLPELNKRLRETMADGLLISIFLQKLQKLRLLAEDRFLFARLRNKVDKIVRDLKQILIFLGQENASSKTLMAQLLPILYFAENIIESFLLKTTYRRHMGVFNKITKTPLLKFSPCTHVQLSCKMKEIEKSVRAVLIKFGKVDKAVDLVPQSLGLLRRHINSAQQRYVETPDLLIGRGDTEKELVGRLFNDDEENLKSHFTTQRRLTWEDCSG
ncbi:hypothetical protein RHMOL_Rhmol09G0055700 [Rhododendron molle]|uniref:Uncharacterized protein n=1 Tax=Rhododendron molle TaxID=49168 RepID=A0ACC0M9Y7_RHOML|nr:hypothetical protein RHMOL_Rhmol09G0055700 [Rhododendron molle]